MVLSSHLQCYPKLSQWKEGHKESRIKAWVNFPDKPVSVTGVAIGVEVWVFRRSLRVKLYLGSDLDLDSITSVHVSAVQISTGPYSVFTSTKDSGGL